MSESEEFDLVISKFWSNDNLKKTGLEHLSFEQVYDIFKGDFLKPRLHDILTLLTGKKVLIEQSGNYKLSEIGDRQKKHIERMGRGQYAKPDPGYDEYRYVIAGLGLPSFVMISQLIIQDALDNYLFIALCCFSANLPFSCIGVMLSFNKIVSAFAITLSLITCSGGIFFSLLHISLAVSILFLGSACIALIVFEWFRAEQKRKWRKI